jgi:phage tail-like protein
MATRRPFDHIGSAKFRVEIEGVTQGAFAAVDGLEAATDVVTFTDGSDGLMRKRPGRTHYTNIVLKRGVTNNNELWDWYRATIDGRAERKAGSIIVLDEAMQEIFRYNFFEGWPCRWKSLVMEADVSGVLVEEIEIAVERIERG